MSVNEKMTSIADKTRELLGVDGKMGLDAVSDNLGRAVDESDTQAGIIRQIKTVLEDRATGIELPTLVNEGQASDLVYGKQLIDQDGKAVTGTVDEYTGNYYRGYTSIEFDDDWYVYSVVDKDVLLRKDTVISTGLPQDTFGNAFPEHVLEGFTFTSHMGIKQEGTLKPGVELPALVNEGTAEDLAYGKQLIDQDGNIVTGTVENGKNVYTAVNGEVDAVHKEDSLCFGHTFETDAIFRKGSRTEFSFWDLGNANMSQVVEGYTFTSEFGLKKTGTLKENSSYAEEATTAQSADGKQFYVESGQLSQRTLLKRNGKIGIYVDPSQVGDFGTATAADVAKGKTFTSAEGYALEGEREESGGSLPDGDFSDPDYVYAVTRPKDWLPMPTPGDDEMYLLNLIPEEHDGCFTAQINFSGSCTVEFGNLVNGVFVAKESLTPTSGTRFYRTIRWEDYADTTSDGFRQYLVKIKGANIKKADFSANQKNNYRYGLFYLVDVVIGVETEISFGGDPSYSAARELKYVRFTGNGGLTSSKSAFRNCIKLLSVSLKKQTTGDSVYYGFSGCKSIVAVSKEVFPLEGDYKYCFYNGSIPEIHGDTTIKMTGIDSFAYNAVMSTKIDGNIFDTSGCANFNRAFQTNSIFHILNLNISSLTTTTNMLSGATLHTLTFAGETTPGGWTIALTSALLSRKALVNMINSLPTALSPATITITGNPGATELTEDEIAVATAKNWTVTI